MNNQIESAYIRDRLGFDPVAVVKTAVAQHLATPGRREPKYRKYYVNLTPEQRKNKTRPQLAKYLNNPPEYHRQYMRLIRNEAKSCPSH